MRVVIADSEPAELASLVALCRSRDTFSELIVVESGTRALKGIRGSRPDVALLACELGDMTGFDVLRALNDDERPATILVAADDRHATEALSSAAIDCITKPFSEERFTTALERVHSHAQRAQHTAVAQARCSLEDDPDAIEHPLGFGDRLVGERAGRLYFLPPSDVDYIEADSNYVQIQVADKRFLSRDSLARLAPILESVGFVRINRSTLLNIRRVSFAEREGRGVLAFVLESGERVTSSAGFRLEAGAPLRVARTRGNRRKVSSTPI
jgi:two-component system, LytTR family, response regulator